MFFRHPWKEAFSFFFFMFFLAFLEESKKKCFRAFRKSSVSWRRELTFHFSAFSEKHKNMEIHTFSRAEKVRFGVVGVCFFMFFFEQKSRCGFVFKRQKEIFWGHFWGQKPSKSWFLGIVFLMFFWVAFLWFLGRFWTSFYRFWEHKEDQKRKRLMYEKP